MAALAELDTAPQTIETTVNYMLNDGTKLFTYTGGPGSTEVKSQGTTDPRRVTMHNGAAAPEAIQSRGRWFPLRRSSDPR